MKKLTKFFNLIKENKQTRILSVMTIAMLFIFTIGYSLSMFTSGSNKRIANIKVNDLSFNITTNSGESNDRILHLQAGKTESFKITITNLNNVDTKYELIYKVCIDVKCTSYLDTLPDEVKLGLNTSLSSKVTGTLTVSSSSEVNILTENNSSTDYYILLDLQAGYSWNDLALLNQFNDFSKYVSIIAYVDGEEVAEYPDSCNYTAEIIGYKNNKQITLEEAGGTCANNKWKISYVGMPDKIQIKFKKAYNLLQYITNLDKTSNRLEIDDTDDQNLRYVGATPNNYISFNNETWRIIGIFNVYNTESKQNEKLVKIIRDESLGDYSWDSSDSTVNSGMGVGEWSQADLMTELNTDYLDTSKTSGTTTWYNGSNNSKNGSYDYSKNIKGNTIDKIVSVRWLLGGKNGGSYDKNRTGLDFYKAERSNKHVSSPNDGIARSDYWDGKIALLYPSDYIYASSDTNCRQDSSQKDSNGVYYCKNDNWLFNGNNQWLLTAVTWNTTLGNMIYFIYKDGDLSDGIPVSITYYNNNVRPALFLKSETKITGGTGTSTNPYTID